MVCRSWNRRSRSHLFKSLDFSRSSSRDCLPPFLDLLSSPHETVAPHVREISLVFPTRYHSITTPLFIRLASLHALESISLGEYSIRESGLHQVAEITAWFGSLVNLKCMVLFGSTFDSFSQLCAMICACRGLESLYMYNLKSTAAYRNLQSHPSPPEPQTPYFAQPDSLPCPPLQILKWNRIGSPFEKQFIEWLGAVASTLPLRSLRIEAHVVISHQALLGRLLRALGPILKELSIQRSPGFRNHGEKLILSGMLHSTY